MIINTYTLDKEITGIVVYKRSEEVGIVFKGEAYPYIQRYHWCIPKGLHPNVQRLAENISDYVRRMISPRLGQDQFALINLPEEGSGIESDFLNARTLNEKSSYYHSPLNPSEFLELQQMIGARFPYIWGTPERPLSNIPEPLPWELELGMLIDETFTKLPKIGIELPELPADLNRLREFYKRRN